MLHFELDDDIAYQRWRSEKLHNYPSSVTKNLVTIANPSELLANEKVAIKDRLDAANWVVYELSDTQLNKNTLHQFAQQFALYQFDNHTCADEGVSEISTASPDAEKGGFIPYTKRPLKWHTDGYYRPDKQWVSSIILHCNRPGTRGGVNQIVDPELLYIHLRDINPDYIRALTADDCFQIPAYEKEGKALRDISHGPVFWFNEYKQLQMRYTQRAKHIEWSQDDLLQEAMTVISTWLNESKNIHSIKLSAGQGILSRNVLHNRSAFEDNTEQPRQLLRARYLDAIVL